MENQQTFFMKKTLLFFAVLLTVVSCGSGSKDKNYRYVAESVGNPYELFVVADTSIYRGAIGDSLKVALREEVSMINYSEPSFDLYNIAHYGFRGVNANQRNLIIMYMGPKYEKAESFVVRDKSASPQLMTVLQAPDAASMMDLVVKERFKIKNAFEKEELSRFEKRSTKMKDIKLSQVVDSMFNINISIPKGYSLRNKIASDFIWISLELPESSQGIVIYDYPYTETTLPDSVIVNMRNKFLANIPGALDNSYMTTGYEFPSEVMPEIINNREWYITRGFWRVENDFMGGPYVSYSTIDVAKQRVVVVDCYVYSPNPSKKQRNFLRQLEGIARTTIIK